MNHDKWLKRKYPASYEEVRNLLNNDQLKYFKEHKLKVGVLDEDVCDWRSDAKYLKGTVFFYKHQKDYDEDGWTGGFEYYCNFKCKEGFTVSGYHSFTKVVLKFRRIER